MLDCFGKMSSLSINYDKSAIIPLNYLENKVARLKDMLGCAIVSLLIQYLGIPLGANPKKAIYLEGNYRKD